MPTLKELQRRLRKIEQETGSHIVTFTMPDGTKRKMLSSRVLQTMHEGFPEDGIRSLEYFTILESVSNNADHKLIELFQRVVGSD